jgi:hypothetical protein
MVKEKKIISTEPEHETVLPVDLPVQSLEGLEGTEKLMEEFCKGPEHELLYSALLLQAIEFMIGVESNKKLLCALSAVNKRNNGWKGSSK